MKPNRDRPQITFTLDRAVIDAARKAATDAGVPVSRFVEGAIQAACGAKGAV